MLLPLLDRLEILRAYTAWCVDDCQIEDLIRPFEVHFLVDLASGRLLLVCVELVAAQPVLNDACLANSIANKGNFDAFTAASKGHLSSDSASWGQMSKFRQK